MGEVNTLNLLGSEIEYRVEKIDIYKLNFDPRNPRVYTALRKLSDKNPSQEQIEEVMCDEENVRDLLKRIRNAGGLVDEIMIRRDRMEVVEGNSRLAAYRILSKSPGGEKWNLIPCKVFETLSDKQTRSLLSEYHIHGRADWTTYEQANIFFVYFKGGTSVEELKADTGLSVQEIKKRIAIIQMMEDNTDNQLKNYSHYEQILTKTSLKKACKKPQFQTRVLRDIKNGSIGTAQDVRDKLSIVCTNLHAPAFKRYVKNESDLNEAYDLAVNSGAGDASIKRLKGFKDWINDRSVQSNLGKQKEPGKVDYEIAKIVPALEKIQKAIRKNKRN